ncbi:hypothetical protein AB9P05_07750 [Roseivirga sp. BDSF3-8]|uniref:hypothetical protein n=1 Tax=Roseivirga sp. BDSF3-8 TaxID=3241598 RepID=UPI0035318E17
MNRTGIYLSVLLTFFTAVSALAQKTDSSIGLKAGDPVGVTYKQYMGGGTAFEVVLGTVPRGWYNDYYRNAFDNEFDFSARYISHDIEMAIAVQARIMWHSSLEEYIPDSEWYWGVGGNLRLANIDYRYDVMRNGSLISRERSDETNFDLGPEIFAGGEYYFQEVPLTAFVELGLMLELLDQVNLRVLGGGGIRYNF